MADKKVLITAYTCCPNRGSEPGNGWNWIINYERNNYEVHVITSGKYKTEIQGYLKNNPLLNFVFVDSALSLKLLRTPVIGIYLHYFIWLFNSIKLVRKIDEELKIDHYHHVTYSSIKFGSPLFNLSRPIILGPLGGASMPDRSLKKYFGKYWYAEVVKDKIATLISKFNPTIKKTIKCANLILVSNDATKRYVERFTNSKTVPMFDAGLADYFKIDFVKRYLDTEEIKLIWVGRNLPRKGLLLALEALYELVKYKDLKVKLFIVGTGLLDEECKKLVKSRNLQHNVTFTGTLNHDEIVKFYQDCHIFIFPSLKDSCPMQVFEAMSTGLPVVTLNHQGMADQVIEGTGIKVPVQAGVNYPFELARAVHDIVSDPNIYQVYSENAYKHGQEQIWSSRIQKFLRTLALS